MASSTRERSRSPSRKQKSNKKSSSGGGFKWKERPAKTTGDNESETRTEDRRYRERSPRRRDEPRSAEALDRSNPSRDEGPSVDRDGDSKRESQARREQTDAGRGTKRVDQSSDDHSATTAPLASTSIAAKFGSAARNYRSAATDSTTDTKTDTDLSRSIAQPVASSSLPPVTNEEMILVHVNDRLGTKAAIPCLASDPVRAFKLMVAARIGRQPHEIMIKRQGERPFKDMLTLADYGVSNGVQLDLELDTGD